MQYSNSASDGQRKPPLSLDPDESRASNGGFALATAEKSKKCFPTGSCPRLPAGSSSPRRTTAGGVWGRASPPRRLPWPSPPPPLPLAPQPRPTPYSPPPPPGRAASGRRPPTGTTRLPPGDPVNMAALRRKHQHAV
eukprot:2039752-Pyramimonas_sp.AAC.1